MKVSLLQLAEPAQRLASHKTAQNKPGREAPLVQHTQAQTARHNPLQDLLAYRKLAQNKPGPEVPLVHDRQVLREPQASLGHYRQVLPVQNGQVQAPEPVPED